MRSFFFHFNKPASQRRGRPTISVHWKGACHLVNNVVVGVPTQGRVRDRQPRFVMAGKAKSFVVRNGVGVIR